MNFLSKPVLFGALLGLMACAPQKAHALVLEYDVTLNTSALAGDASRYRLDYFLTTGSSQAANIGNSSATLGSFNFGTNDFGPDGSGTAPNPATIRDQTARPTPNVSNVINLRGDTLSFSLDFNYTVDIQDGNAVADSFAFAIRDLTTNSYITAPVQKTGTPVSANTLANNIYLVTIDLTTTPAVRTFDNNNFNFTQVTPVPEPTTMALMALGLSGVALRRRRKKDATARRRTV